MSRNKEEINKLKEELKEVKIETKHCIQCNKDMLEFKKLCVPHERQIEIIKSKLQTWKLVLTSQLKELDEDIKWLREIDEIVGGSYNIRQKLVKKQAKKIEIEMQIQLKN